MTTRITDRYDFSDPIFQEVGTPRQLEVAAAMYKHKSSTIAAKELGISDRSVRNSIEQLVSKYDAVKNGKEFHASPDVSVNAAPGFQIGKVTIQRKPEYTCPECGHADPERIVNIWDRQFLEPADKVAMAMSEFEVTPLPKRRPIKKVRKQHLLNLFTLTDFHLGMYAWEAECGEAWDTQIAGEVFYNAFVRMHEVSPDAGTALLNIQGDFLHWDGLDAVTPTNKHLLDADTRFGRLVGLSMDMITWAVDFLSQHYDKVHVIIAEGNHDVVSSIWLRHFVDRITEKLAHVSVDMSEFPYYAYLFGQTMIGVHHGHMKKMASLPSLFSQDPRFRAMWGQAVYCYIHMGHWHHQKEQIAEFDGAIVFQHPTLSAKDAYASRGGYNSARGAYVVTYDDKGNEVQRNRVTPEAI